MAYVNTPEGTGEKPVIDVCYAEIQEKPTRRINLGGILGSISFLAMIAAPGAVEGGMYITAVVLVVVFAGCAHLSIKEDGKRK